jgi:hypothetical protein
MPVDEMTEAVAKGLSLMAALLANPKPITADLVEGWVLVLRQAEVRPEEVSPGVVKLLQTEKFFPTPADFLKAVRPVEDPRAALRRRLEAELTSRDERRSGGAATTCLPGSFERQNLANGRALTPAMAGRPDWKALPESQGAPALPGANSGDPETFSALADESGGPERSLAPITHIFENL